jgi:2-methylisocitrate lyase-like PEP mutase family enzyme
MLTAGAVEMKAIVEAPGASVMPGAFEAMGARLIAEAGYRIGFVSGSSVAGMRLAQPDVDVLTLQDMAAAVDICSSAASEVLWMADGDTGYGNEINVRRTIIACAKAGASAILIEDKAYPRPLGHQGGKAVVARAAARRRCAAAVEACRDAGILLLARTDAIAVHGRDEALARIADFAEAGADMVYLDSPATLADVAASVKAANGTPAVAVIFQGAKHVLPSPAELEGAGIRLAIHPADLFAASAHAMRLAINALKTGAPMPPIGTEAERGRTIRRAEFLAEDKRWSGI